MAGGSNDVSNVVLFGAGYPTITSSLQTNDTYMQTDTGLPSGLVLAEFVFSREANLWVLTPGASSGSTISWAGANW
jgi:hypothetical protein